LNIVYRVQLVLSTTGSIQSNYRTA